MSGSWVSVNPAKIQLFALLVSITLVAQPGAASKLDAKCGACQMIVTELEHGISKVDPKKRIEVGSFRVDPKGNQYVSEVSYARSEQNLHEILDNICDKSSGYGYTEHPETRRNVFVRTAEFDGRQRKFSSIDKSPVLRSRLRSACDDLIDEHEEDIIAHFKIENDSSDPHFCEQSSLCMSEELVPFPIELEEEKEPEQEVVDEDDEDEEEDENEEVIDHTEL